MGVSPGKITRDGYVINTSFSINHPRPAPGPSTYTETGFLIPNQTNLTIGDLLTARGISWAWYSVVPVPENPLFRAGKKD